MLLPRQYNCQMMLVSTHITPSLHLRSQSHSLNCSKLADWPLATTMLASCAGYYSALRCSNKSSVQAWCAPYSSQSWLTAAGCWNRVAPHACFMALEGAIGSAPGKMCSPLRQLPRRWHAPAAEEACSCQSHIKTLEFAWSTNSAWSASGQLPNCGQG